MREKHPYGEFIPKNPKAMIIGSFPIGKFTHPARRIEIKPHEYDFFFGGEKNLLWKLLSDVFEMPVNSKDDIIRILTKKHLAVGDVIKACRRKAGGASDADLYDIKWNTELLRSIKKNKIMTVYFTSKKVQHWFYRLFPQTEGIQALLLISPSAQSMRSLSKRPDFQAWVKKHPKEKKFNYILEDYRRKFKELS